MNDIGFLGVGNMAQAIIGGLLSNSTHTRKLAGSQRNLEKRIALQNSFESLTWYDSNQELAASTDTLVLAVKPKDAKTLCESIQQDHEGRAIISLMAGISTDVLKRWLPKSRSIIRAMPNTPALIQQGITGLYSPSTTPAPDKHHAESIFEGVGDTIWLESEEHMHLLTALSGSGPAYVFKFAECLMTSATELGLPGEVAEKLTLKTLQGASLLASMSDSSVSQLRENVTSKGGTTEAGLNALQKHGFDSMIKATLEAAAQRSKALSP